MLNIQSLNTCPYRIVHIQTPVGVFRSKRAQLTNVYFLHKFRSENRNELRFLLSIISGEQCQSKRERIRDLYLLPQHRFNFGHGVGG